LSEYENKPRNRDNIIWAIVVVMMVVNVGVLTYTTIYNDGNVDTSTLETQIQTLEFQLGSAEQEIDSLKEEIRILDISETSQDIGVIEIYNQTRNSVVLIETDQGSAGSGWVYDTEGHIVTNNHVVEDAQALTVTFQSGTVLSAKVVGLDPYSDMAVIKVNAPNGVLHPLEIGISSELLVGETAIAIGNLFGLANTMTVGVISATGRQMDATDGYVVVDVIQTDAAINPGNSGGPLLNLKGEVIGMNTAIISSTNDFSGIGFAIPSDTITREITSLIETGEYEHPWLGISGYNMFPALAEAMGLDNNTKGTLVARVVEDGPADEAGLIGSTTTATVGGYPFDIGGDVIIGVNGLTMDSFYKLQVYLTRNTQPNETVTMSIIRDGEVMSVEFTLGVRPPPS